MSCPNCGSNERDINDIDSSICCTSCGATLEEAGLEHENFDRSMTSLETINKNIKTGERESKAALNCLARLEIHLRIPEPIVKQAATIIKRYSEGICQTNPLEKALCAVYLASKDWKSDWKLMDFAENTPAPVDIYVLNRILFQFLKHCPSPRPIDPYSQQADVYSFVQRLYPDIQTYFGTGRAKKCMIKLSQLQDTTWRLIQLGDIYYLNAGKKVRPTIIVTTFITACSLQAKATHSKAKKRRAKDKKFIANRLQRYKHFEKHCPWSIKLLCLREHEYISFLCTCSRYLPWLDGEQSKSHIHHYLDDILEFFGKPNIASAPKVMLSPDQYTTRNLQKIDERREKIKREIESAVAHMEKGTMPSDGSSLESKIYQLIQIGYQKEEVAEWTERYIRYLTHSHDFREHYGTDASEKTDLDRPYLDEDDMNDEEIDLYCR